MRTSRLLRGALVVIIVAAGLIGVALFVISRDSSTFSVASGPGQLYPDQGDRHLAPGTRRRSFVFASSPPTSGPHVPVLPTHDAVPLDDDQLLEALELGDVVLLYGDRVRRPSLAALAAGTAGPFSRSLVAAGQAVVLDFHPGTAGIIATAWRHLLRVGDAADPRLRAFIEFWLGRGARGG